MRCAARHCSPGSADPLGTTSGRRKQTRSAGAGQRRYRGCRQAPLANDDVHAARARLGFCGSWRCSRRSQIFSQGTLERTMSGELAHRCLSRGKSVGKRHPGMHDGRRLAPRHVISTGRRLATARALAAHLRTLVVTKPVVVGSPDHDPISHCVIFVAVWAACPELYWPRTRIRGQPLRSLRYNRSSVDRKLLQPRPHRGRAIRHGSQANMGPVDESGSARARPI